MKSIFDHIENVKGKPHHVRKRVALTTAGIGAGLVAVIWLGTGLATGAFALKVGTFADNSASPVTAAPQAVSPLAGAAAALSQKSAPAHIEIIDAASSSAQAQPTVIPF